MLGEHPSQPVAVSVMLSPLRYSLLMFHHLSPCGGATRAALDCPCGCRAYGHAPPARAERLHPIKGSLRHGHTITHGRTFAGLATWTHKAVQVCSAPPRTLGPLKYTGFRAFGTQAISVLRREYSALRALDGCAVATSTGTVVFQDHGLPPFRAPLPIALAPIRSANPKRRQGQNV